MSNGIIDYVIEPDPLDPGSQVPPNSNGATLPGTQSPDWMRCNSRTSGGGSNVLDPDGNPTGDTETVPGSGGEECCIPICGVTPTEGGFPGGNGQDTCPVCEPTEPTSPDPGSTMSGGQVPPVGDTTARCGIDAYEQWAHGSTQPGVTESLRVLRSLIYGDQNDEDSFVTEIEKNETSLFPSRQVQGSIQRFLHSAAVRIDEIVGGWIVGSGCFSAEHSLLVVQDILVNILQLAAGTALGPISQPIKYKSQAMCPVCYPDQRDAVDCFLRGSIDRSTFETWIKQNNYCVEPMDKVVDARQSRLTPTDMLAAWRRKMMGDERIDTELRNLGFTNSDFREWMRKLTEFVPPIQDLVRFMVRDVEDVSTPDGHQGIVERFGLDSEFENKWKGQSKEWGTWQGISDEQAKRYWRAHWQIPSPTQLFEMYHVSRSLAGDDPARTSLEDVTTALQQQDILPYWIPKLLATTYSRMSRVDVRRAYNTGVIDRDQVLKLYTRLGYRDEDATALTNWTHREKLKAVRTHPTVKLFSAGLASRMTASNALIDLGLTPDEANQVLDYTLLVLRAKSMGKCVNSLRKRYLIGDLTENEWRGRLAGYGFQPDWIDLQIESASCERESRGKMAPTATLCGWYDEGLIDSGDYTERLVRLGWTADDALKILTQCSTKINVKRQKEAERTAKYEAAKVERMRKEMEREAAKRDRQLKQSNRARQIAEKARQRRTQLLGRATELLSQSAGVTVDEAGSAVQGVLTQLSSQFLLTADTRVQAILMTVEKFNPESLNSFRLHVVEFADELERLGSLPELS